MIGEMPFWAPQQLIQEKEKKQHILELIFFCQDKKM